MTPPTFRDHFSSAALGYAAFRPVYPDALFSDLASRSPARGLAWDCGTGSGQAARGLAAWFERVVATDASHAQLGAAEPHARVRFVRALAESSPLRSGCVDLVVVAQALHWFDRASFFAEARRVLAPRGVVAVWCYGWMEIEPEIDARMRGFYRDTLGPYWPPERVLVESGYADIEFPFERLAVPRYSIEQHLTLEQLVGYVRTWSAVLRYLSATGRDPVADLVRALEPLWGPSATRAVVWPLAVLAGRVSGA